MGKEMLAYLCHGEKLFGKPDEQSKICFRFAMTRKVAVKSCSKKLRATTLFDKPNEQRQACLDLPWREKFYRKVALKSCSKKLRENEAQYLDNRFYSTHFENVPDFVYLLKDSDHNP